MGLLSLQFLLKDQNKTTNHWSGRDVLPVAGHSAAHLLLRTKNRSLFTADGVVEPLPSVCGKHLPSRTHPCVFHTALLHLTSKALFTSPRSPLSDAHFLRLTAQNHLSLHKDTHSVEISLTH
jgi:hypothetical protein